MKKAFYISYILILLGCQSRNPGFKITGFVSTIHDRAKIYLSDAQTSKICDSAIVTNGKFTFSGKVDSIWESVIHTKDFKEYKTLWIDNANLKLDARNTSLKNAKISGSQFQEHYSRYMFMDQSWNLRRDSINRVIRMTSKSDSVTLTRLKSYRDRVTLHHHGEVIEFFKACPDFYLTSYFITYLMYNQPKQLTEQLYNSLSDKGKNNKWGRAVETYINKATTFSIGDTATDFSLPDINGTTIQLSSFKGKYLLLEFWASWCGPCRAENPNLLKVYRKYQKDGFEILGVSLDENKDVWQNTIKTDTLIWETVSDLKANLGEIPLTYKVYGIPMNYLIDPSGKIIELDLRGISLENKLKAIFNH
jgi:peroxiredoxin